NTHPRRAGGGDGGLAAVVVARRRRPAALGSPHAPALTRTEPLPRPRDADRFPALFARERIAAQDPAVELHRRPAGAVEIPGRFREIRVACPALLRDPDRPGVEGAG